MCSKNLENRRFLLTPIEKSSRDSSLGQLEPWKGFYKSDNRNLVTWPIHNMHKICRYFSWKILQQGDVNTPPPPPDAMHRFVVSSDVHSFFDFEGVRSACFIDDSECRIITSFTIVTSSACVFCRVLIRSRALFEVLIDLSREMNGGFTNINGITASTDKLIIDIESLST